MAAKRREDLGLKRVESARGEPFGRLGAREGAVCRRCGGELGTVWGWDWDGMGRICGRCARKEFVPGRVLCVSVGGGDGSRGEGEALVRENGEVQPEVRGE